MEWMSILKAAVDYIEDRLCENITVDDVAEKCGVSSFYLQKGFSIISGYSIGEYIRSRRLYKAALDLKDSDEKVIDVALKYCYETPESFTKAFSRFHGCPPVEVRNKKSNITVFLPIQFHFSIQGGNEMNCRIEKMESFKIVGFKRQFNVATSYKEIPEYWGEIFSTYGGHDSVIKNHIGTYGACVNEQQDGFFDYMIAGPYDGGIVPPEMYVYEFPAGEWAKFDCTLETLHETNDRIFKEWLPANDDFELTDASDIEWYNPEDETGSPDCRCSIWIQVRRV